MTEVSIRQFQQNPSKYLSKLPVLLTKYNKPVASILPYKPPEDLPRATHVSPPQQKPPNVQASKPILVKDDFEPRRPIDTLTGRCTPPNSACKGFGPRYHVEFYHDIEGLVKLDINLCELHARKAKSICEVFERIN